MSRQAHSGVLSHFRVGAKGRAPIGRELRDRLTREDLVHLHTYHIYMRLMIDGQPSNWPLKGDRAPSLDDG